MTLIFFLQKKALIAGLSILLGVYAFQSYGIIIGPILIGIRNKTKKKIFFSYQILGVPIIAFNFLQGQINGAIKPKSKKRKKKKKTYVL